MKQGDYEMESGRLPLPIMNRFHQDEKALHQVGSLFFLFMFAWLLSSINRFHQGCLHVFVLTSMF